MGAATADSKGASRAQRAVNPWRLLAALVLITLVPALSISNPLSSQLRLPESNVLVKYAAAASSSLLQCFQVYPPVLTPTSNGQSKILTNGSAQEPAAVIPTSGGCSTTQTLMTHSFGSSIGHPYSVPYAPPANCNFNRVTFNFTAAAAGRQFDRLGAVYLGDIEIWRFSTAEPTLAGITWTYIKDMSHFYALLDKPQKLIVDLDNVVDSTYTAAINVTLQATYFNQPDDTVVPADQILPISARMGSTGGASAWQVPPSNATNAITLPRNVNRAVVGIGATGQSEQEFWYSNVYDQYVNTYPGTTLYGGSPFKEAQLFIDGTMAGVVWPFPIIFTGGVVPGFWRPEVGIDAFDLRYDEIDITPWLGLLCDGKSHSFTIKIAGLSYDGKKSGAISPSEGGSYWIVSGQIFLWLDPAGSITTGPAPKVNLPAPAIAIDNTLTTLKNGTNDTLTYTTSVQRQLSITSLIKTAKNSSLPASWNQSLSYTNYNKFTSQGITQLTKQTTDGTDVAAARPYARQISYPLTLNSTYTQDPNGNTTISATIDRSQDIKLLGVPVFPSGLQSFDALPDVQNPGSGPKFQGSELSTRQNGSAYYNAPPPAQGNSTSFGSTEQVLTFKGLSVDHAAPGFPPVSGSEELYMRHVLATNGSVVFNQESLVGRQIGGAARSQSAPMAEQGTFSLQTVLSALGRGPGQKLLDGLVGGGDGGL